MTLVSIAAMPMPTSTSRYGDTPRFHARTYSATAVSRAPASAPADTISEVPPTTTMTKTADVLAPAVIPTMSGLASGLRATLWKMAPESPKAAPTSRPVRARGSRTRWTMNSASSVPAPKIAGTTSASGIGKSPTLSETANTTTIAAVRARPTIRDRRRTWERARCTTEVSRWTATVTIGAVHDGHRQSSASLRRRTRMMKNGAPTRAVTMPTWTSPGRVTTRPMTSAPSSRIGARTAE